MFDAALKAYFYSNLGGTLIYRFSHTLDIAGEFTSGPQADIMYRVTLSRRSP